MRENEFERKVQEQMEDLRLRPSEEIWPKVEKELRRKKRRRVVFFIFLLAGLGLLGYSGYTFFYQDSAKPVVQTTESKNNSTTVNDQTSTNTNTAVADHEKTPAQQSSTESLKTNNNEINLKANDKNDITGIDVPNKTEKQSDGLQNQTIHTEEKNANPSDEKKNKIVITPAKPRQKVTTAEAAKNHTVVPLVKKETAKKKVVEQNIAAINTDDQKTNQVDDPSIDLIGKDPAAKKDIATVNNVPVKNIPTAHPSLDSAANLPVAIDSTVASVIDQQKEELLKDSAAQVVVNKKKTSSKIKFGVEVSGGISSSRKDLIGLSTNKSLVTDNRFQNTPGTGTNVSNRVIIPPSVAKSGNGFRIGLVGEKMLSRRSSLSLGLRYTHMDEHIKVGSYKDTLVFSNSYQFSSNIGREGLYSAADYANGSVKISDYTSRYHFLEIPIQYQLQLNKSKRKLPVLWNLGLTAGYLLSTNAVVYDTTAGGIYFRSKDAFKRFHASFQTGISFLFGSKNKIQWSFGPDISLDMTRLMKEDVFTRKRYLLYAGVTGKVFFATKKK